MMQEDRCVLCNGGNVENVKHFYWSVKILIRIDVAFWKGPDENCMWEQRSG